MTKWIREHIATIAVLVVVTGALLAGVLIGGLLAFASGLWVVASGVLGDWMLTMWGLT